jgi:Na+-translocating ferredoxin:NAD+ oxidoreductase RnfD subunit
VVPAVVIGLGLRLNLMFTGRIPLIASFVGCFLLQGVIRSVLLNLPMLAQLGPLTGVALILFTFYMITDPQTSPSSRAGQIAYGGGIALTYGLLLALRVRFTPFYAVLLVASARGLLIAITNAVADRKAAAALVLAPELGAEPQP